MAASLLTEPVAAAKHPGPARLETHAAAASVGGANAEQPAPSPTISWEQLQALRRGRQPPEPWLHQLETGALPPEPGLLGALWGRLDRPAVQRLLASAVGGAPQALLAAGRAELPALAADAAVREAWLQPLLDHHHRRPAAEAAAWLELLAHFRHPEAAARLRAALQAQAGPDPVPLLPLLGSQRDPRDARLLQRLALEPGPRRLRRAALEGVALGLAAWPPQPLIEALATLAQDLDPGLGATAVDLLARMPQEQARRRLRGLLSRPLDPAVQARLRRRLRLSPLVLLVHGRQAGRIPPELQALATALEQRRGSPVLVQALTAEAPQAEAHFWQAAQRAGQITLVPLLLLPGGHVRHDLPAVAAAWRARAAATATATAGSTARLRRWPFLGAWPGWQRALAETLEEALAELAALRPGATARWLHHPLSGALAGRYLDHLAAVLGQPGLSTPYSAGTADLALPAGAPVLLLPLTLAANRLSEGLRAGAVDERSPSDPPLTLLPPLLEIPALRQFLLSALEVLP